MVSQKDIAADIELAAYKFQATMFGLPGNAAEDAEPLYPDEYEVMWLLVEKMTGKLPGSPGYISTEVMASQRWVATRLGWQKVDTSTGEIFPDKERARAALLNLERMGVILRVPYDAITYRNLKRAVAGVAASTPGRRPVVYELNRGHGAFDPLDFEEDD